MGIQLSEYSKSLTGKSLIPIVAGINKTYVHIGENLVSGTKFWNRILVYMFEVKDPDPG